MKKRKKIIIATVVLVGLSLVGTFNYFYFTGAFSAGNGKQYSLANTPSDPNSLLKGKTIIFLGSSVTYGMNSGGESFVEYMEKVDGIVPIKEAVSGTTLVDNGEKSYIQRMLRNIPTDIHADAFVCQLSTNDASKNMPMGEIVDGTDLKDFDTSTITGAMEYIICYAKQTWGCPVLFYTGSWYNSDAYDAMVQQLFKVQQKWDITVIDLWTDESFNNLDSSTRSNYISADGIHPFRAGYRDWWLPKFQESLTEILG